MKPAYPTLKPITIRRLRKVQAAILADPTLYDQDEPSCPLDSSSDHRHNCGSAGCIMGYVVALFGTTRERYTDAEVHGGLRITGGRLLRLDNNDDLTPPSARLYYSDHWPQRYAAAMDAARLGSRQAARIAVRRIDHFIKTGGEE